MAASVQNLFRKAPIPQAEPFNDSFANRMEDGWFWALRDIELSIATGDIVGIVGRNGAGKSTLLKILARIVTPTFGRVGVRGRVGSLLEVGTGFHPELTGRENIFLNGAILGMSRSEIRKRFDEIVAFAEIDSFLETPVKRYSSGMAVRLAFAVAAHLEPDVLIIDEVLSVGDQAFQRKCLGKASQLGSQGRTVLVVSHNLAAVANLCHRAVLLQDGRLIADDVPERIIEQYLAEMRSGDGQRHWDDDETAPSCREVSLRSVSVMGNGTKIPVSEVEIDQEILVVVEYRVLIPDTSVSLQIQLKDETGSYVFWSANAPSMNLEPDPWFGKPHPIGLYRGECRIPANFLNDTRYFVSVLIGPEVGVVAIRQDSVISFLVHDTGAMRQEYSGSWHGPVVRPRLHWRTNKL
ncbi:MAG TPA: ABC transporter ATP-binding protein [Pirellula sp.]|nr:ABC transporter ATP-binding protein [Pirellula sp.]